MRTWKMRTFLAVALAGTLAVGACGGDRTEEHGGTAEAVDVAVSPATRGAASESYPAQLTAEQRARVATRTSGRIVRMTVDVGSAVSAGETLAVLDDTEVRARMESAASNRELAERSFRRIDNLAEDGAASQQELDEARARLEQARAAEREAAAQLEYVVVRAPFSGFVESRHVEPGDLAGPGQPLLTLVGGAGLQVQADLPAEMSGRIQPGDPVHVRMPGEGGVVPARVSLVAPSLEPGSRRLRVEAIFEPAMPVAGDMVPGAYVRMELPGSGAGSLWIPDDAVVRRGQLTGVFQVSDGELRLRWLRLGREQGGAVEVLAGPAGDLTVVRSPAASLRDGQRVGSVDLRDWSVS